MKAAWRSKMWSTSKISAIAFNAFRGPVGVMVTRRERGRTALQSAEKSAKRAVAENVLRDEENRLALIEAQKVRAGSSCARSYSLPCATNMEALQLYQF